MKNFSIKILKKDLLIEFREKTSIINSLFFAFVTLIIFNFSFHPGSNSIKEAVSGILWIVIFFSGVLILKRSFEIEKENHTFEALLLIPDSHTSIYIGKLLSSLVILLFIELILFPLWVILFNVSFQRSILFVIFTILVVDVGFVSLGVVLSAISLTFNLKDVIFTIIFFPLLIPLFIGAVKLTEISIIGGELSSFYKWLKLITSFDIIFFWSGYLLFKFITEER